MFSACHRRRRRLECEGSGFGPRRLGFGVGWCVRFDPALPIHVPWIDPTRAPMCTPVRVLGRSSAPTHCDPPSTSGART